MYYSHRLFVCDIIDYINSNNCGIHTRSAIKFLLDNQYDVQAIMDKLYRCTATNEYLVSVPDYYDVSGANKDLLFKCLEFCIPEDSKEDLSGAVRLVYNVIVERMENVKRRNPFFITCPYCGERLTYTEVSNNRWLCSNCGKPAHYYAYTGWNKGYTNSKNRHKYKMKHKLPKR